MAEPADALRIDVVITPDLVAAIAATIAAILSGIALWLGGARGTQTA
jgi:hypothetical protein